MITNHTLSYGQQRGLQTAIALLRPALDTGFFARIRAVINCKAATLQRLCYRTMVNCRLSVPELAVSLKVYMPLAKCAALNVTT